MTEQYADSSAGRLLERGTLYLQAKNEFIKSFIIMAVVMIGSVVLFKIISNSMGDEPREAVGDVMELISLWLEGAFYIGWTIIIIIRTGKGYQYEVFEKEFHIHREGRKPYQDVIYYCDVLSVRYEPMYFLFDKRVRGYEVTVVTKYRSIVFKYVFGNNKVFNQAKDTPFRIIEERAGLVQPAGALNRN